MDADFGKILKGIALMSLYPHLEYIDTDNTDTTSFQHYDRDYDFDFTERDYYTMDDSYAYAEDYNNDYDSPSSKDSVGHTTEDISHDICFESKFWYI